MLKLVYVTLTPHLDPIIRTGWASLEAMKWENYSAWFRPPQGDILDDRYVLCPN